MNFNQIKLKVFDTHKEDDKITTNYEAVKDESVIKKLI